MPPAHHPPAIADSSKAVVGQRRRRRRRAIVAALTSVPVAVVLIETVVRLGGLGPEVYAPRRFEPGGGVPFLLLREGDIQFPVYQPNVTFASVYDPAGDPSRDLGPDGRVTYRINRYGLRGDAVPMEKPPGGLRVVCLGDSITFGEGVREEFTYPARLRSLLREALPDRPIEVINAGVQAFGTREAVAFFFLRCERFRPDEVTLGFFLNDLMDYGETIRQNDAITAAFKPSAWGRIFKSWEIIERRRHSAALQKAYFASIRASFDADRWDLGVELLSAMQEEAARAGFRFTVIIFPVLWNLEDDYPFEDLHARVAEACRKIGCGFLDLLPELRHLPTKLLWVHPTDHHPNRVVHEIAARRLADHILDQANP